MDFEEILESYELKLEFLNLLLEQIFTYSDELLIEANSILSPKNHELSIKEKTDFYETMQANPFFLKLMNLIDVSEYVSNPFDYDNYYTLAVWLVEKYAQNNSKVLN